MELKHYFGKHSDALAKLQEFQKETTKFQEKARTDFDKISKRFESMQMNIHQEIVLSQEQATQRLHELEAKTLKMFIDTDKSIHESEQKVLDIVNDKDKRLSDTLIKGVTEV